MENPKFYTIQGGIGIIEFNAPDSKVNVLSEPVLKQLDKIIESIKSMQDLKAVLITSKKENIFIVGADIKEIELIQTKNEALNKSEAGQEVFNKLESLDVPTIALINGACLGGGLELALACKYRIAGFSEKVKIGLPEVGLGIIPGFGGTQRLPRLIGLQKGIEMITSGKAISSRDALKIALVDMLCSESRLLEEGIEFVKNLPVKKRKVKSPFLKRFLGNTLFGRIILFSQSKKIILKNTKGFYPASLKALKVIKDSFSRPISPGLRLEREGFAELITGDIAKNLIALFFLNERYKRFDWVGDTNIHPKTIKRCGILGAGVMGAGIAQVLSSKDLTVRMKDLNYQVIGKALKTCNEIYKHALKKHIFRQNEIDYKMGLISAALDYSGFKKVDIVIEAIVEDIDVKKKVMHELCEAITEDTIIASNTSTLPITEIAKVVLNPSRIIGMHFFNPAHRMSLTEVIPAKTTSREVIATVVDFSRRLGKFPVVVKDSCGFLVNRILLPYLNEAGFLLDEGFRIEVIDNIMTDFGMPIGPLAVIDEIGLDIGYKVAGILERAYPDRMSTSPILKQAFEAGWLGKKAKKGFYIHKGRKKEPNREIYRFVKNEPPCQKKGLLKRMVLVMLNEACRCLEDGIVNRACDIDISMIMGSGFPPFRGGLFRYADSIGLEKVLGDLERFYKIYGNRFRPTDFLVSLVKENKRFYA